MSVSGDIANIGNKISWFSYMRPNLVGDPELANPTVGRAFNPAAFAIPDSGTYGNAGRNILRTESAYRVDFSLFKNFPIHEDAYLQFRFEAFNVFNIMNYGAPSTGIGWPAGGFNPTDFPGAFRIGGLAQNSFPRPTTICVEAALLNEPHLGEWQIARRCRARGHSPFGGSPGLPV